MSFLSNLFGGGSNSSKRIDYERPEDFDDFFFEDQGRFLGEDGKERKEAKGYFDTLYNAVNLGNLDLNTALAQADSRIRPGSDLVATSQYRNLANYQMPDERAEGILDSVFSANLFRSANPSEYTQLFKNAKAQGVFNDPNELRNFLTSQVVRTPEFEGKGPMTDYEQRMAAYYGRPRRDETGKMVGYAVYGDDAEKYKQHRERQEGINSFVNKYLGKMGAKGSIA